MRKTMLAAAAVAALLSIGATANKAAAMPTTAPTQLGLAASADTHLVQKAALVCGYYGCRRVWGGPYWGRPYWAHPNWGWHRHYWGWHRGW
ncbi:MAG TPA: hypothetical protein VHU22_22875 [Xanthobacteraceae bacterium]|jgi:hypothetical protein|nr:hypothetical protein [Xanthobacteraceae bacterium]